MVHYCEIDKSEIYHFESSIPELDKFSEVADTSRYAPLPEDWSIGVSDVINSTDEIEAGRYKAVNLAGAATISAVANALRGELKLFVFGGDGSRVAVSPDKVAAARDALSRVAMWAKRDLGLDLRVGVMKVSDARSAGFDVRVAFWRASDHVRYAMFTGGGLEWIEAQLKNGVLALPVTPLNDEPDLTGLSCQWGPIVPRQGKILSLIVKPVTEVQGLTFSEVISGVIDLFEKSGCFRLLPEEGLEVRWPTEAIVLQSRIAHNQYPMWLRKSRVLFATAFTWLIFKLNVRIGKFEPRQYRRQLAANADFRKFDDGLLMTVDCSTEVIARLQELLDSAAAKGVVSYGIHVQDKGLITCVVPSVFGSNHWHFVDGADGGYAAAARMMKKRPKKIGIRSSA